MNSKTLLAVVSMASFTVAALPAAAQDTGAYVGASIGMAKARQVCANATNCDEDETAYKAFGGYQFHKNLAAEAGFQYFGMFGRDSQGISTTALDATLVGSWPVMNQLSVYGKAGLYFASMKSKPLSEDNTGIVYGAGVEYALSRELGLRGEWQRYNNVGGGSLGFNTDIDVISAAVVWRPR